MPVITKESQDTQKTLSKLVAQAWLDEEFKQRFIAEPATVLEENGVSVPSGVTLKVKESTSPENSTNVVISSGNNGVYELLLPSKPAELTEEQVQLSGEGNVPEVPGCF